jgi:hypothetical protein
MGTFYDEEKDEYYVMLYYPEAGPKELFHRLHRVTGGTFGDAVRYLKATSGLSLPLISPSVTRLAVSPAEELLQRQAERDMARIAAEKKPPTAAEMTAEERAQFGVSEPGEEERRIITPVGELKMWDFFKDPVGAQYVETRQMPSKGALLYARLNGLYYRPAKLSRMGGGGPPSPESIRLDRAKLTAYLQETVANFEANLANKDLPLSPERRLIDKTRMNEAALTLSMVRNGDFDAKPAPKKPTKKGGKKR